MLARGDMPLLRFMGRRPPTEQAVLARLLSGLRIGEYAPYVFVEDENEFEKQVQKMAAIV